MKAYRHSRTAQTVYLGSSLEKLEVTSSLSMAADVLIDYGLTNRCSVLRHDCRCS